MDNKETKLDLKNILREEREEEKPIQIPDYKSFSMPSQTSFRLHIVILREQLENINMAECPGLEVVKVGGPWKYFFKFEGGKGEWNKKCNFVSISFFHDVFNSSNLEYTCSLAFLVTHKKESNGG